MCRMNILKSMIQCCIYYKVYYIYSFYPLFVLNCKHTLKRAGGLFIILHNLYITLSTFIIFTFHRNTHVI